MKPSHARNTDITAIEAITWIAFRTWETPEQISESWKNDLEGYARRVNDAMEDFLGQAQNEEIKIWGIKNNRGDPKVIPEDDLRRGMIPWVSNLLMHNKSPEVLWNDLVIKKAEVIRVWGEDNSTELSAHPVENPNDEQIQAAYLKEYPKGEVRPKAEKYLKKKFPAVKINEIRSLIAKENKKIGRVRKRPKKLSSN